MDFRAGRLLDGSRDPSTLTEESLAPLIRDGDMVVFFEGREPIGFDRMKPKTIWQCRHGAFHHDEIIGKPFGSRVFSRTTKGYVYALSPTPELWSHVVPNRTQIVQDFDQSIVIFRLDLKPGDIVVESGTGSGVMSTAIMRTIAPSGFLHSFEFNEFRATRAQEEFEENSLGGLVKVAHRDVCASRADGGGFGEELDGKADAVFLDLPEPWLSVEHAKSVLKPGKKVCSYSPCIEQVMKTCEALRSNGFHSVTTIEFRLRNINYTEVQLDVPDFGSFLPSAPPAPATASAAATLPGSLSASAVSSVGGSDGNGAASAEAPKAPADKAQVDFETAAARRNAGGGDGASKVGTAEGAESCGTDGSKVSNVEVSSSGEKENGTLTEPSSAPETKKRPRQEASAGVVEGTGADDGVVRAGRGRNERLPPKAALRAAEAAAQKRGTRKPPLKLVCAQPFPLMRGHTAFLTFAATPVARQLGAAAAAAAVVPRAEGTRDSRADGQARGVPGGDDVKTVHNEGATSGVSSGGGGSSALPVCEEGIVDRRGKEKAKGEEMAEDVGGAAAKVVVDNADSSAPIDR
ncbi:unnamed protein product [Scytosiphon promiscuus]